MAERHGTDPVRMPQASQGPSRGYIPETGSPIPRPRQGAASVRAEGDGKDGVNMPHRGVQR